MSRTSSTTRRPTDAYLTGQDKITKLFEKTQDPLYFRSHEEIPRFFDGFELVEPELVSSAFWRPSVPSDISNNAEMNADASA